MRCRVVLLAGLVAACGGLEEDPGAVRSQQVIDDLVAHEYGRASSRYRLYESEVLSAGAAPVWRRALGHEDATVREWAVDSLSRIGQPGDFSAIEERLDDTSRGVRLQAVDALIRIDSGAAGEVFAARLQLDDPVQVALAAGGLATLGDRSAVPTLAARLRDTALPAATRAALTQPLAALGDAAVVPLLVDVAIDPDTDLQLRRLAAEAAVAIDARDPTDAIGRLEEADDDYVRVLGRRAGATR